MKILINIPMENNFFSSSVCYFNENPNFQNPKIVC